MAKKKLNQPIELIGMLYQKTNEDFNKEKPNPLDPIQLINNPIQQEVKVKPFKKNLKKY